MRIQIILILISSFPGIAQSQTAEEFLRAYNRHIDPLQRLDSIDHITIKRTMKINVHLDNRVIQSTATCYHCTNGKELCLKEDTDSSSPLNLASTSIDATKNNVVRYMLNWIFVEKRSESFHCKMINDSIVVIEEFVNSTNRNVFTFEKESLNLVQIRSISKIDQVEIVRDTNFLSYDIVDGILVPKGMLYESSICTATVEYLSVSFAEFSQSVFD